MGHHSGGRARGGGGGIVMVVVVVVVVVTLANGESQEEDDLAEALGLLYGGPEYRYNIHDMLTRPGEEARPNPLDLTRGEPGEEVKEEGEEVCDASSATEVAQELSECRARLSALQDALEAEQARSLQLQKVLAKEGSLDLQLFYRRATQHLWTLLNLEEGRSLLKEGNKAILRQVTVRVTDDDLDGLDNYLKTETVPHKVDEFLQHGFTLDTSPLEAPPTLLQAALNLLNGAVQAGKSLEVWLGVLCAGFVVLAVWAVVLFVGDIQRELRWRRVLVMMVVVVFGICCLWHWRHMYKLAESRRHAQLAKRGFSGLPEECQPGARTSAGTFYDWFKVNLFGSPDPCDKYFEEIMIDALEEITPSMVISETISRFLFQPLQHFGTESGKLTTNFYKNVPPAYHLHATALFLGLLVVVLFYGCAYGIDFPLGLGGYRPMTRQASGGAATGALGQEALDQLGRERDRFLQESRQMLQDIATAVQATQGRQQLVVTSSGILEGQLERLIARRLDQAMDQEREATAEARPGVDTITSTPLSHEGRPRRRSRTNPEVREAAVQGRGGGGVGPRSHSEEGQGDTGLCRSSWLDDSGEATALLVATDAVHRRVAGTAAVRCLPPRNPSRSCSRSSSAASSPAPSELGSPATRRQKGGKFMRMFRSVESAPSPLPSPSPSTQSLGQTPGLDEPDLGQPPDSDSFLAEVRSVLDISVNSDPPSPPGPPGPPSTH